MKLTFFQSLDFLAAIKALLTELQVPFNAIADEPVPVREILSDKTYKDNATFRLINEVFFVGMVDDAAFEGNESLAPEKIKSDYDGILFFGVTLDQRVNNRLPTRGQLADIARAFNREFYYTPVVVIFKYQDEQKKYIAFANTERLPYKQEWREGEKAGKVSLLRDITIDSPHRGHEDIINQLRIPTSGTKAVTDFDSLYKYWQEVFSVSILNKKFYQELSNWYFWAIKNVTFPNSPTPELAHEKGVKLEELAQEHNASNVIRLLTRLLFTWFIKEKKLIPEEFFDLEALQKDILKEIYPYHEEGMFKQANEESVYYKAILQNLFFASLNCPIEPDDVDERKRGFRGLESYGKHRGVDYLMRYEKYFKDQQAFLDLMNSTVPFLNGGLFECLDEKLDKNLYIDGFSDQMTKGEQLIVPDYLFFGLDEEIDLSKDYGLKSKKYKKAAVKGLINILKSYKFTVTENTPIEEDVALDPELLGKVFENLLASYNPETKTTARKQTGSFYTPREIVNYMVDESLIAYLKNAVQDWEMEEEAVDKALHQLTSFDALNPFADDPKITKAIIAALDRCKILDPACGSGAFPMGVLQKMVHILQKLDHDNEQWKELQLNKALQATEEAYDIEDKAERKTKLLEINDAFDESVNDPDYARKLYLIENCIYGVDIQPIATQISKLRFFISLVVDQKVNIDRPNFGIRALPNLEIKFVTANTLIGIEKPSTQTSLFSTDRIKELEGQLKQVRKKLFSARTKRTKTKYRLEDERLRNAISEELKNSGWPNDTAEKLAAWDPYDQNASSPFFDPEWMFDIKKGFNITIGNPPYLIIPKSEYLSKYSNFKNQEGKPDLYRLFIERGFDLLSKNGVFSYITPNTFLTIPNAKKLRNSILQDYTISLLVSFDETVFESASVNSLVFLFVKGRNERGNKVKTVIIDNNSSLESADCKIIESADWLKNEKLEFNIFIDNDTSLILNIIAQGKSTISQLGFNVSLGAQQYHNTIHTKDEIKQRFLHSKKKLTNDYILELGGRSINSFSIHLPETPNYVDFSKEFYTKPDKRYFAGPRIVFREITGKTIISSYTEDDFVVNKSCYSVFGKKDDLKALQLTLSSRVLGFWVNNSGDKSKQRLFPRITKNTIKKMPLALWGNSILATSIHDIISFSVGKIFYSILENVRNAVTFNLYFPEHMKEREIDVLKFVEHDLEKVLNGREFDSLSDREKEGIVEELHATWTHPDNEVRNRIKLFAVRSPEILKPILEG